MPWVKTAWHDDLIPIVNKSGVAVSTTGWVAFMTIRKKNPAATLVLTLTTAGGKLDVGLATLSGGSNGIRPDATADDMNIPAGNYKWDFYRTITGIDHHIVGGGLQMRNRPLTQVTRSTTPYKVTPPDTNEGAITLSDLAADALAEIASKAAKSANLSDLASAATARTNLGLGTAALKNTGTIGDAVPLLNAANTFSFGQIFTEAATVLGSTTATFTLAGATSEVKGVVFQTAAVNRWEIGVNASAELGSNTGSDFRVRSFDDAGTLISNPIVIDRATSEVTLEAPLGIASGGTGATTAAGATAALNTFTTSLKGLVPASGGGTSNFMRADGTWAAFAPAVQTFTLAGDQATGANTTPVTLTGLVFNYEANSTYRIWFMGRVSPAAATTGCGFQFDLSSAVTSINVMFVHQLDNTGTLSGGHSIADDASVGVSSGMPGTSTYPVRGDGILITTGNTGTAQLRFRSETTAVTTAKAGLTLVVEKIA